MRCGIAGLSVATLALVVQPAPAQRRTIDLTGRPAAQLTTPVSAVSHGVELRSGSFVFVDRREVLVKSAQLSRDTLVSLGRVGSGPAEYRRPLQAVADGQGGALIPEASEYRLVRVLPTGEVAGMDLPLQEAGIRALWIRGVDPQGRVIHWGPVARGVRGAIPIHRWDPATGQSTLLGIWPTTPAIVGAPTRTPQGIARELSHATIWPLRATWVALPDGAVAIVHPRPYHLEIIKPDGRKVQGPTVQYEPVRVSSAMRDAAREERGRVPDEQFPSELPPFEGLEDVIGSPRGEVWVGRMQYPADAVMVYDIFSADGIRVGEARLRKHSKVVGFGVGSVYVAREDVDTGLWYLERYQDR